MKNQRKELSKTLRELSKNEFDVIIIGGGATGLGCALDATLRGYSTLLVEKDDFVSGTSSKSTKLIHGGVRYLEQFDIPLVIDALKERSILLKNAPNIVKPLPFIIPAYSFYEIPYYFTGLKMYDLLAWNKGIKKSKVLNKKETHQKFSNIQMEALRGSIMYYDAQFDDALLAMSLLTSIIKHGGICANYCEMIHLEKNEDGQVVGVQVEDKIANQIFSFNGKSIINATGIFSDNILKSDQSNATSRIRTSRGSHVVVPQEKFPMDHALLIPKTKDGRVIFAVPWYNKTIIGTTDISDPHLSNQPKVSLKEIDYILETVNRYLHIDIGYDDITSTFCALRPLVKSKLEMSSKEVSRRYKIEESKSGMISILGGKWTTYRAMAEDTIDYAMNSKGLEQKKSKTEDFSLQNPNADNKLMINGKLNNEFIKDLIENQMATSLEDILARRTRSILLDVEKSKSIAMLISNYCKKNNIDINYDMKSYSNFSKAFDFRV